jgi:hypothetical protein
LVAILPAAIVVVSPAHAGEYDRTYSITGRASVRVQTDEGSVRVITSDTSQVQFRVKYDVSPWRLGFGAAPHVESDQKGDVVELNAHAGWHVGVGIGGDSLEIEVRMPKDADLQLDTGDGSVEIASLNGHVVAHSTDGHIQVSELTGAVDIRSTEGAINARALKGDVKLQTADGSITAANLDGKCSAYTNDGSVTLGGRFDSLDVRSDDGSVSARAESGSTISSDWHIRTAEGSVHVALPDDLKANIDASTSDGHIHVNLPVKARGNLTRTEFHGVMNGGGPAVVVHTTDGSVEINHL